MSVHVFPTSRASHYRGRFAPSPTGPLHAGSLVAALASWLDARAQGGTWLVRMEDVDAPRCKCAWGEEILQQLAAHGLHSDEAVLWQSTRTAAYDAALAVLQERRLVYACTCSRKQILAALELQGLPKERHGELVYPGTCRALGLPLSKFVAFRFNIAEGIDFLFRHSCVGRNPPIHTNTLINGKELGKQLWIPAQGWNDEATTLPLVSISAEARVTWHDATFGAQSQNIAQEVGDFVLRRADGCYSYQLAVVVDDASQGITHIVRGADLLDNTARQLLLQGVLGYPQPQYRHTPLVLAADGQKLSKQNGAQALAWHEPNSVLLNLRVAGAALGLLPEEAAIGRANARPASHADTLSELLEKFIRQWKNLHYGKP